MNVDAAVIKQISRAGRRRTVAQPLRTWDASQESLRNYTCKDAQKGCCPRNAVYLLRCIFTGSLRRLLRCIGGGFRFPPFPMSKEGESLRETRDERDNPSFASADKEANMEEPVDRIEDYDGKQSDCLVQSTCDLVSKMHAASRSKLGFQK